MSSPHPSSRFQFRLSYLIYLLTLVACSFALLRQVIDFRGGWVITTVLSMYVAALTAYFAIRLPLLLHRIRRQRAAMRHQREELARVIAHRRFPQSDAQPDADRGEDRAEDKERGG